MSDVKSSVDARIAGKKVVIYSKSYCPYCAKAKKVFKDHHVGKDLKEEDYEVIEIENDKDCAKIQNYMKKLTGGSSVPRVFINGKFVGGGDDIVKMEGNGQLAKLLK